MVVYFHEYSVQIVLTLNLYSFVKKSYMALWIKICSYIEYHSFILVTEAKNNHTEFFKAHNQTGTNFGTIYKPLSRLRICH